MEQYLLRNHETRKYLQEQAYRLQQGIVMTTTQQVGGDALTHTHTLSDCLPLTPDDGHHVCEGPGPPELSAVLREQPGPGGREGGPEPDEGRQELQDGETTPSEGDQEPGDPDVGTFSPMQLLPSLYHLRGCGATAVWGGAIQEQLESMAGEVARVVEEQLQVRAPQSWTWNLLLTLSCCAGHVGADGGRRPASLSSRDGDL